jgi:hypothetical protein
MKRQEAFSTLRFFVGGLIVANLVLCISIKNWVAVCGWIVAGSEWINNLINT